MLGWSDSKAMLTALMSGLRFKLAIALTAFAALCFVVPPAGQAFGHGAHTAHCLAHADLVEHGVAKEAGFKTHNGHSTPAGAHQMTCCGLFCLSAIPADGGEVIYGIGTRPALFPAPKTNHLSQAPERPVRPPISLLAV
jgi:hypothetical protein